MMVKPKQGHVALLEKNLTVHVAAFHEKDTSNKMYIYEVQSGDQTGIYYLAKSDIKPTRVDTTRRAADQRDLENTILPELEMGGSDVDFYTYVDTLSYKPYLKTSKFRFTYFKLKQATGEDFISEIARAVSVYKKMNVTKSFATYVKQPAESETMILQIDNLENGYKELEAAASPKLSKKFKEMYVQMFGHPLLQKRMSLLSEITANAQVEMVQFRPDLSSK